MRYSHTTVETSTADRAFAKAYREARLRRTWAHVRHAPLSISLESFESARASLGDPGCINKIGLGVRKVCLQEILGSVARSRDFDNKFLPLHKDLGPRWKEIYQVLQSKEHLGAYVPPIKLYMIGNMYFVNDGNHRVSVARFRDWTSIEAEVTLLRPSPDYKNI